ncbi:hypothetical protein H2203_005758 [Taxawa tesnikishii (nom. ined.)]|nr:hypothetical protein H2203_005758 [Dothideales sp. JES 119]
MSSDSLFKPIVCVVDFHHARGPEVETWIGVEEGLTRLSTMIGDSYRFLLFRTVLMPTGEDFSYFSLVCKSTPPRSLFGISCTRQLDATELKNRPKDVTRSVVQKAVVVITDSPQTFSAVREKLSVVTRAWFAQKDFTDREILQHFQESLCKSYDEHEHERDQYFGLSLREIIHEYKWQTLVLFKCLLLQPKMLFFGAHCEQLCLVQFSLISLIPGLMRNLRDCADPQMDSYAQNAVKPTSLRTSERASLLTYMGLPLQIFGKGSLFGPYTPLQQLDTLADQDTKSYIVGSTNTLLLQQKDRYADVLIHVDEHTVNTFSPSLRSALVLSTPDRRWIDFLTQTVQDTWDDANPSRPKTMGYAGSEEFIRLQFEEYMLALLASAKYRQFVAQHKDDAKALLSEVEGDPSAEFSNDFVEAWMKTENFALFNRVTDSHLFDIVEPRHPCAGGLTIEDVQRRLAQQVQELHLDERLQVGREAVGKHLAAGRQKVGSAINTLWADIEVMREAQRKRAEEQRPPLPQYHHRLQARKQGRNAIAKPDLSHAQASVQAASSRAGAYLSSWGTWAAEKRKGWAKAENVPPAGSIAAAQRPSVTTVSELSRGDVHKVTTDLDADRGNGRRKENEGEGGKNVWAE